MILLHTWSLLVKSFHVLLHLLVKSQLLSKHLRTHRLYFSLQGFSQFHSLTTSLFVLDLKGWADERSWVFSAWLNVLIKSFADLSEAFRVVNLDVYAFTKGLNEILHLLLHIADVIDYILWVNLNQSDSYCKVLGEKRKGRLPFDMIFLVLHIYEL